MQYVSGVVCPDMDGDLRLRLGPSGHTQPWPLDASLAGEGDGQLPDHAGDAGQLFTELVLGAFIEKEAVGDGH
ncbi:Uncharacterised protein [Mycobacteroides abscessus subsp. abscessus]|nr:Uncharacterised protein [Mycobacteroides abscessus subsp. abscessus]